MSARCADEDSDLGGTMRLGAYHALLAAGQPGERNIWCHGKFPSVTAIATRSIPATGIGWRSMACGSPACRLTGSCRRSIEIQDHPWFIGVQFHPELKSRPFDPHPLFASFVGAAVHQSRLV